MSQPNTKPSWIIHNKAVEREAYSNLAEIVRQCGYDVYEFDNWELLLHPDGVRLPSINDAVIPYCTYVAARQLRNYSGMYMNEFNQLYHVYTSLMGLPLTFFLNQDAVLTSFYYFRTQPSHWFNLLDVGSNDDQLFVRPDSGAKLFTGHLIPKQDWDHYINALTKTSVTDESLVWVAREKVFWDETRFVICGKEVVDGSRYCTDSGRTLIQDKQFPQEFWDLAQLVANCEWKPDEVFTVDICSTTSGPKIVELNSFNCASWYACDAEKIVKAVTEHTMKVVQDWYE
jgi:hypothetical protein